MKKTPTLPWADLHCHSQASDGILKPGELVRLAKKSGLQGLCITDHDTIAAYPEAQAVAKQVGLHLGVGIEFSCAFENHDVHVLGYDFDLGSKEVEELCLHHDRRRYDRNLKMLEKLRQEGLTLSFEELKEQGSRGSIGRPHIAQAMVQKRYVTSIKEAFKRYLGEGKRCYVRGEGLRVDETIEVIHSARGKAFVAHPHLLLPSFPIDQLLKLPFDGIECFYAKIASKKIESWITKAQDRGWLISGGSDFHGFGRSSITLGCQGVDRATFYQIFEHSLV